ncbi:hypothetical protein [Chitinophaga cymbidii]|uniref:Uncharacterized protein n=1 Tax=Chitinophaga cymbidii TaxID=1096750 RepID=A0A512RIL5_9BACT|nr:hypothetical protein [Chitinophaga cymbidii]GEP95542.1 hypothetical protein CCY01nite_18020 [Chitinophaga cymbidii]
MKNRKKSKNRVLISRKELALLRAAASQQEPRPLIVKVPKYIPFELPLADYLAVCGIDESGNPLVKSSSFPHPQTAA